MSSIMSIVDMNKKIVDLIYCNNTYVTGEIPGLDLQSVVDNLITKKYSDKLSDIPSEQDRINYIQDLTNYFCGGGEGQAVIEAEITTIQANYSIIKSQLVAATNILSGIMTQNQTLNGGDNVNDNSDKILKKNILLFMINCMENEIINLLQSAIKIYFNVPSSVMNLIDSVKNIKEAAFNIYII